MGMGGRVGKDSVGGSLKFRTCEYASHITVDIL